jgi:hypothetical protein
MIAEPLAQPASQISALIAHIVEKVIATHGV